MRYPLTMTPGTPPARNSNIGVQLHRAGVGAEAAGATTTGTVITTIRTMVGKPVHALFTFNKMWVYWTDDGLAQEDRVVQYDIGRDGVQYDFGDSTSYPGYSTYLLLEPRSNRWFMSGAKRLSPGAPWHGVIVRFNAYALTLGENPIEVEIVGEDEITPSYGERMWYPFDVAGDYWWAYGAGSGSTSGTLVARSTATLEVVAELSVAEMLAAADIEDLGYGGYLSAYGKGLISSGTTGTEAMPYRVVQFEVTGPTTFAARAFDVGAYFDNHNGSDDSRRWCSSSNQFYIYNSSFDTSWFPDNRGIVGYLVHMETLEVRPVYYPEGWAVQFVNCDGAAVKYDYINDLISLGASWGTNGSDAPQDDCWGNPGAGGTGAIVLDCATAKVLSVGNFGSVPSSYPPVDPYYFYCDGAFGEGAHLNGLGEVICWAYTGVPLPGTVGLYTVPPASEDPSSRQARGAPDRYAGFLSVEGTLDEIGGYWNWNGVITQFPEVEVTITNEAA